MERHALPDTTAPLNPVLVLVLVLVLVCAPAAAVQVIEESKQIQAETMKNLEDQNKKMWDIHTRMDDVSAGRGCREGGGHAGGGVGWGGMGLR